VWLDPPDFPQLAVKGLSDAAAAAASPGTSKTELRCAQCQTRLTAKTRIATPKGDFCARCAPAGSLPAQARSTAPSLTFEEFDASVSHDSLAADVFTTVIGLLFDLVTDDDDDRHRRR
jgi:hypothetical protein